MYGRRKKKLTIPDDLKRRYEEVSNQEISEDTSEEEDEIPQTITIESDLDEYFNTIKINMYNKLGVLQKKYADLFIKDASEN